MKKKRKFPIKSLIFFLAFFCIIAFIHISFNIKTSVTELSPNWSRSFQMTNNSFNRGSLVEYSDNGYIVFVSPIEDGVGGLKLSKFDTELNKIEEYEIKESELNFNYIYSNDIIFKDNEIYWRNYKDNSLYLAKFDEDYKTITSTTKIMDNINSFYVEGETDKLYLAVANLEGSVELYIKDNGAYKKLASPIDVKNINTVKLLQYNDVLYLQSAKKVDNYESSIYISEFENNMWNNPVLLNTVNEMKVEIVDMDLGVDSNYLYSLVTTRGNGQSECTYIVAGYDHGSKQLFDTLKLDWARNLGVQNFSSEPVLISSNSEGIEIFVTAPNDLSTKVNSSNVIKMLLTPDGLKESVLVSNTRKWSNRANVLDIDNNSRYVFWNEYDELGSTATKGASNKASIIERATVVNKDDIKFAVDEDIFAITYLFLLCFGVRLLTLLPSLFWLLGMAYFNEKIENKHNLIFVLGVIIYLGITLLTIDFYYNYQSIALMPGMLNFYGVRYIIPLIFTVLGSIFVFIFKSEDDSPQVYKIYALYLLFNHVLMNYLYAPYIL